MAVQAMNWEQVSDKNKEKINTDIVKLAQRIQKAKIHVGIKTRFMFGMMRMMQMKGWGSGEAEKEYWKKNGWLDKKRPWN